MHSLSVEERASSVIVCEPLFSIIVLFAFLNWCAFVIFLRDI